MRKDSKIFPCAAFLSCVVDKIKIGTPLFQPTFRVPKNSCFRSLYCFYDKDFRESVTITYVHFDITKLVHSNNTKPYLQN